MDTPDAGRSAMNPKDPEQYLRELEHGGRQKPTSLYARFSGAGGRPTLGESLQWRFGDLTQLAKTPPGRLILVCLAAFTAAIALFVLIHFNSRTTVHGNLVMIDSGAKATIDCNGGNLKLDGSNNTYTVTGHCRRIDVFGSANHVTVDSADAISVFGDDNAMVYHFGAPTITKTGNNNIVTQRR